MRRLKLTTDWKDRKSGEIITADDRPHYVLDMLEAQGLAVAIRAGEQSQQELPQEIPYRSELVDDNIKSMQMLLAIDDLETIEGIGEIKAGRINDWLREHGYK